MSPHQMRSGLARAGIVVLTIVLTWGALLLGRVSRPIDLEVGQAAPQTYAAPTRIEVVDEEATARARQRAADNTPSVYTIDRSVDAEVVRDIESFFFRVRALAQPVEQEAEPTTTTTVASSEEEDTTTTTSSSTTTTVSEPIPEAEQVETLQREFPQYDADTVRTMVEIANRPETGSRHLEELLREARLLTERLLQEGITQFQLSDVREELLNSPQVVLLPLDLPVDPAEARRAVSDLVANSLQANRKVDPQATQEARNQAAASVPEEQQIWRFGEQIVAEGEPVSELQLMALQKAGLLQEPDRLGLAALLAVVAVLVIVLAFYLARFRPDFWRRPRRVLLFGLLLVLGAFAARSLAVLLLPDWPVILYLVPAAGVGFLAAVLFDARMAVLTAVAMGAFTGLAVHDPETVSGALGYAIFAMLATLVPVPFVSAISSRGEFRKAVLLTGLVLAPMAAVMAWLFQGDEAALQAVPVGLASGWLSGFLAMGLLPFLENLFDITTTLTLLDLTDRNHPALQRLEEKALGTFNHSLMVGTLADAGARAVGANPLLARAAAYYHDLGKTENPWFYIENQFGGVNPHDSMPPEESADIIRQHVVDGVRLAEEFRIPTEVAEGVLAHHGTGLMRFFYHKAMERYGERAVDPARYRHQGVKPHSKEMTILMLADAVEGACRAMVLHEEPTAEGIRTTIERVVGEKLNDGQLDESDLTLGDLHAVKEAFAASLIGHYHQRIPYPGFPEDEMERIRRQAAFRAGETERR